MKNKWFVGLLIMVAITFGVVAANAGTVQFSWEENDDLATLEYAIYCSTRTVEELNGDSHELYKSVLPETVVDGRVQYLWGDFPEGEEYHCVVVGLGIHEGERTSSAFSEEVDFILDPAIQLPGVPQGVRVDVTVIVNIN